MIRVRVNRAWRVRTVALVWSPLPPSSVWGEMRGFTVFAAADPFHREIHVEGGRPRAGATIEIVHRYAGITVRRTGRILRWNEGKSFVFSDLSKRGSRRSFPHIFSYTVHPHSSGGSILRLDVRGRWTATWIPRPLVTLWQWWVMVQIRDSVRTHLLWLAAAKRILASKNAPASHVSAT